SARIVADTIHYTPVAIRHIINEAVKEAYFAGRQTVTYADVTQARLTHEMGIYQPLTMTSEDKKRVAYHEAGHAVVGYRRWLKGLHYRVNRATIRPRRGALGMVMSKPEQEKHTRTYDEFIADIDSSLASRAVEELVLNIKMSGFSGDLTFATQQAVDMI